MNEHSRIDERTGSRLPGDSDVLVRDDLIHLRYRSAAAASSTRVGSVKASGVDMVFGPRDQASSAGPSNVAPPNTA